MTEREPREPPIEGLEFVVSHEARRVLSEAQLRPDPALVRAGWERRFIADGKRADEAMALYRELGFEVHAEPVTADEVGPDCDDCQLLMLFQFKTIYTRRPRGDTEAS